MTLAEPIILTKKKTGIAAYREKKGFFPTVTKVLTSPKTTIALGATLGALLTGGALAPAATGAALRAAPSVAARSVGKVAKAVAPKTLGGAVKTYTGGLLLGGALVSSPKLRKTAKKYFSPSGLVSKGKKIGEIIEEPSKASDILGIKEKTTLKEKLTTGLKAAGIVGGAAALGIAGKKAIEKFRESRAEKKASELKVTALGATEPRPVGLGGIPVAVPTQTSPAVTGAQPTTAPSGVRPIQNIIQIAIR